MTNNHPCKHAHVTELAKGLRQTKKSCPRNRWGTLVVSSYRCSICKFYKAWTPAEVEIPDEVTPNMTQMEKTLIRAKKLVDQLGKDGAK